MDTGRNEKNNTKNNNKRPVLNTRSTAATDQRL